MFMIRCINRAAKKHTFSGNFAKFSQSVNGHEYLMDYPGGSVHHTKCEESGIAVVTLDHIEKKNAMSGSMMADLNNTVADLESWQTGKGVILRGTGNTFCSGGDLNFVKGICNPQAGVRMCSFMQDVLSRFFRLPLLSVALLEGSALGGGAELAVACDLRVATNDAIIGFVQGRMGVSPGWGGGARLVEILGRTEALKLLCSCKVLTSNQAKDVGLVDEILKNESDLLETTKQWLKTYTRSSSSIVSKQVVMAAVEKDFDSALLEEKRLFGTVWGGKAHVAAMNANIRHKK